VSRDHTWRTIGNAAAYVALTAAVVFAVFPILWTFSLSFKTEGEYFRMPPTWIPVTPTLRNYEFVINVMGTTAIKNSLIIVVANVVLVLLVSIPAAYAIARFRTGGDQLANWILSQRMFPPVAAVLPLFLLLSTFQLVDTHIALIVPYATFNVAFAVWMLSGFFAEFPRELEEAAQVDGASRLEALLRIVLPITAPALVVVALFCFIFAWNEFLFALILTRDQARTIPVALATFQGTTRINFGEMSALAVISMVPVVVMAVFLQRYLVRGLSLGAVKE